MRQKQPLSCGERRLGAGTGGRPLGPPARPRGAAHAEVGELQGDLDEGVGAGPALLDQPLPEVGELEAAEVHVVGQRLGHAVRALDGGLALRGHTAVAVGTGTKRPGTGTPRVSPAPTGPGRHWVAPGGTGWPAGRAGSSAGTPQGAGPGRLRAAPTSWGMSHCRRWGGASRVSGSPTQCPPSV